MYITLNNFALVYMLCDDKLYMLKSINKVSVLFCSDFLQYEGILCVLIRIASTRRF